MPTDRDNADERTARLEHLLEEYRVAMEVHHDRVNRHGESVRVLVRRVKAQLAASSKRAAAKKR